MLARLQGAEPGRLCLPGRHYHIRPLPARTRNQIQEISDKTQRRNLQLQLDKCEFLRKEIIYLGHVIDENRVRPDLKKLEAVQNFPKPINPKHLKQFLGLACYYRRFILAFAKIAKLLT